MPAGKIGVETREHHYETIMRLVVNERTSFSEIIRYDNMTTFATKGFRLLTLEVGNNIGCRRLM